MESDTVAVAIRKHILSRKKHVLGVYSKPEGALPLFRRLITDDSHSGIVTVYRIDSDRALERYKFNREQGTLEPEPLPREEY